MADGVCDPTKGIFAMKMGMTLTLEATDKGNVRYETMTYLRNNVTDILGGKSFPYSFQFLYWEETGVIGKELVNNLLSCGAVIIVMIILMIPHVRIAPWVIFGIVFVGSASGAPGGIGRRRIERNALFGRLGPDRGGA